MNSRKIIVYVATSADGYIARADGSVDWLNRRSVELALLASRRFTDGVVRLHYRLKSSDTIPG